VNVLEKLYVMVLTDNNDLRAYVKNYITKIKELLKYYKKEEGAVLVIAAFSMVILLTMAAFVIDLGLVDLEKQKLQTALDAASLAGAQALPDTATATNTANQYIQLNGFSPSIAKITFSNSNSVINITATKMMPYMFAQIINFDNSEVNAVSAAQKPMHSSGYALFAKTLLKFTAAPMIIDGKVISNGDIYSSKPAFSSNPNDIIQFNSTIEHFGVLLNSATGFPAQKISAKVPFPTPQDIGFPDIPAPPGGYTVLTSGQLSGKYNTSIYYNGNIVVNDPNFECSGIVYATGQIAFSTSAKAKLFYSSAKTGNAMIKITVGQVTVDGNLYSESSEKAISITGNTDRILGGIYAPNGQAWVTGSNSQVSGGVFADTIILTSGKVSFGEEIGNPSIGKVMLIK